MHSKITVYTNIITVEQHKIKNTKATTQTNHLHTIKYQIRKSQTNLIAFYSATKNKSFTSHTHLQISNIPNTTTKIAKPPPAPKPTNHPTYHKLRKIQNKRNQPKYTQPPTSKHVGLTNTKHPSNQTLQVRKSISTYRLNNLGLTTKVPQTNTQSKTPHKLNQ